MRVLLLLALAQASCLPSAARADSVEEGEPTPVLSRVRARGVVRCGGVERPGLAAMLPGGQPAGLEVDVCRAVAAAVLGEASRFEFRLYAAPKDFEAVKGRHDDVSFLSGSEMVENGLTGEVVPTAIVFAASHAVMVPGSSRERHVSELAGDGICFLIGSSAARSLEAYFADHGLKFLRHPYSEEGEMSDAYAVQHCHAVAGESTTLARMRLEPGVSERRSRLLPEPLSIFPILATTGTRDGRWSAIVSWTVNTLLSGERPETRWYAGGAAAMPVDAARLGLEKGWQERVLGAVGTYGDLFERNLGRWSPLEQERGLNDDPRHGGLLLSPFAE